MYHQICIERQKVLTAEFKTNFSETLLVVKPMRGEMLQVDTFTHFTGDNRTDYCNVYRFKPGASPSVKEDCVRFNPNTIEVKRINGRWKIVDGSHFMFDFGNSAAEAKQAFAIIKKYGFAKSCFVGRPDPSFEYLRR
jgi:hypothetical protein